MKSDHTNRLILLGMSLALCVAYGCDTEAGGGDESCPEYTVRSGADCVPIAGETSGGIGPVTVDNGGESVAGSVGAGSVGAGSIAGETAGEPVGGATPTPLSFPIFVDDVFSPSGFMGEGEFENISADLDCPERDAAFTSVCHHFSYAPGDIGWGGVWWQSPENNWGDEPGVVIPEGLTSLTFRAWGATGGELLRFGSGYGGGDDEYAVEIAQVTLSTEPQIYSIDLAGVPYTDIAGGFFWVTDESETPLEFYIDELTMNSDVSAEVNPCVVGCSTMTSISECTAPSYLSCASECEDALAGACGAQAIAYHSCITETEWRCVDGSLSSAERCETDLAALLSCTGGPAETPLPFALEERFFMSGYMGDGEVEAQPCPEDLTRDVGACLQITWTPNGAEWVGFFFQYPENNWGDMPGLMIEPGATHVRYRVWGERGDELLNLGVGITDADGFGVETGYMSLTAEPTEGYLLVPDGVTEVTGAFAWYLENPDNAESITFYLDDVVWRDDAPPSTGEAILGCTNPEADNFNALAETDDGSCVVLFSFAVDMSCAGVEFSAVYITGPFCSWCAEGYALSDPDADDIWTGTYSLQEGSLEFKYMVDGFASQESLLGAGSCAPLTDNSTYANREVEVVANGSVDHVYGRCSACDEEPPPATDFETVTFDDPAVSYTMIGFGGADASDITIDPTNMSGQVGRVSKSATAELWAGTTFATQANEAVGALPIDVENTRMSIRVYAPHAGIAVRLKAEDSTNSMVSVETEATVSVQDAWEVLTFDFANQAPGTSALNPNATYDKLTIFFNFGVTGADAGERTYYFDDVTFIGGTSEPPTPVDHEVTFEVDMTCPEAPESFNAVYITGEFCSWCAEGYALSDPDNDGVWTGTFTFPAGPLEYKFMVDGFADQEDLTDDVQAGDGACAPVTDGLNYANRRVEVSADAAVNAIYGRCNVCTDNGLGTNGILDETDGWRLTWSDEFNSAENTPIDSSKWTHDVGGGGWGNAQLEYNTNRVENSYQSGDGYLVIKAIRESYQGNEYTSARIKSQGLFSQQYGRFEAKIKLPYGRGLWPAFWLLGSDIPTVGWPNCGEIDIMEFRGQNLYESTGALHGPGYSGGGSLYTVRPSASSLAAGFHTYAVEWSPTEIKWYVDSDLYMERSASDIPQGATWAFDHDFFMILNVAVGGNFLDNPDASTSFPQEMLVDYVRVYEAVVSEP